MFDEMFAGALARRIRRDDLTYLSYVSLRSLRKSAREVRKIKGVVVEAGIALGGSGILLATELSDHDFHGYDVFAEFPPPGPDDTPESHERYEVIASGQAEGIGRHTFSGYMTDLYGHVSDTFGRYGLPVGDRIHLHKGRIEETLKPEWPIALAHIDCDWYDPVKVCLERVTPHLQPGARVILDDYYYYGGCRKATDEFLESTAGFEIVRDKGHLVLGYSPANK
ncbi:TylF/MycF/NovP-related O-methyltransferase [Mycobacterium spongiae]|uniref:Asparagine synthase n=1 Tax=Mycobacterium spongiae TaxID=886343 RepID=A0A975JYB4_9MYCO|nr:TylF/MycF/NovP-related O-methyltransferase [Mycobacterium spongiae]QUR67324.1 asparagine synthase [Mycobacterium spongiae]